jgi:hypothetical protein
LYASLPAGGSYHPNTDKMAIAFRWKRYRINIANNVIFRSNGSAFASWIGLVPQQNGAGCLDQW